VPLVGGCHEEHHAGIITLIMSARIKAVGTSHEADENEIKEISMLLSEGGPGFVSTQSSHGAGGTHTEQLKCGIS
jgi:hypothetical protein